MALLTFIELVYPSVTALSQQAKRAFILSRSQQSSSVQVWLSGVQQATLKILLFRWEHVCVVLSGWRHKIMGHRHQQLGSILLWGTYWQPHPLDMRLKGWEDLVELWSRLAYKAVGCEGRGAEWGDEGGYS